MALSNSIAVANAKGGVGRTSLAVNLAGVAARHGARVLLADTSPQGDALLDLGYTADITGWSGSLIQGSEPPVIRDVRPGLDLLPGGRDLHEVERRFAAPSAIARSLESILGSVGAEHHLVVIDTPSAGPLLDAVLAVAGRVVIPVTPDEASLDGMEEIARRFAHARASNPQLELLGVALFGLPQASKDTEDWLLASLVGDLGRGDLVIDASIRNAPLAAAKLRREGRLAHEVARQGTYAGLADDYTDVAGDILERFTDREVGE